MNYWKYNLFCFRLNPQNPISTSTTVSKRSRTDPFWDTSRKDELVELILEEAKLLQERRGNNESIFLSDVIKSILRKKQEYQNYSVVQMYSRLNEIKRHAKDPKVKQVLQQIDLILSACKKK